MSAQITACLSDEHVAALDVAATAYKRSRAEVVRKAVVQYLEDFDGLPVAVEQLRACTDPALEYVLYDR